MVVSTLLVTQACRGFRDWVACRGLGGRSALFPEVNTVFKKGFQAVEHVLPAATVIM